jgi:hypothetical protein
MASTSRDNLTKACYNFFFALIFGTLMELNPYMVILASGPYLYLVWDKLGYYPVYVI